MVEKFAKFCSGCRTCELLCPYNAIEMKEDARGFIYPNINKEKCIKCGLCVKRCPINNKEEEVDKVAYAAYNKDEEERLKSSSGGIFSILARYILEKNGVVFGAAFDTEFNVRHICISRLEDIMLLRGSKYVQSDIGDSYKNAKKYLEEGKLVYFSGTPCQIEGLKAYISKEYTNLYTQDVICHGVPSPKVWKTYLKSKKKDIYGVNFRAKEKNTWGDFDLKVEYKNSKEYINHEKDEYMKLFLNNHILRESCYQCKFKKKNRASDFTLADFWGINNIDKSMNDEKGTSLIILNSDKAKRLIQEVSNQIVKKEVNLDDAIKYNLSMIKSVNKGDKFERISRLIEENREEELFKGAK